MKKLVMTCALLVLVCLALLSIAHATIMTGSQDWYKTLNPGESLTCITFYGLDSVEFTQVPVWWSYDGYNHSITGWQLERSVDKKISYLYGPRATNSSDDPLEWFSFELFYQWDTDAEGFDHAYPVYQDMAIFDGPMGSPPIFALGFRGTPGDSESWEYKDNDPDSGPYETDEPYENPTPELTTIFLFGLGAALLRKKRRRKTLSLYKLQ